MQQSHIYKEIWDPAQLVRMGKCPLCGSPEAENKGYRQDGLPLVECRNCELGFVDPRPSPKQLHEYYSAGYFDGERDFFSGQDYCSVRDEAIQNKVVTGYQEIVSHLNIQGKALLDIGCASGALLQLLKEHHPARLVGIDLAEYPIRFGKERYHLDLRCTTLEQAHFQDGEFDLIVMIDVIEHIEDLRRFLHEIGRVLRAGGNLFFLTPNHKAFSKAGNQWISLGKDFEHLHYFQPALLDRVAQEAGLHVAQWWTDGLPVALLQYPRLYPIKFHSLLHPGVGIGNIIRKLKYTSGTGGQNCFGQNLWAILRKRD